MDEYLTTKQVMKRYSVTRQTVNNWVRKGYIVPFKTPRKTLFSVEAIKAFENKMYLMHR